MGNFVIVATYLVVTVLFQFIHFISLNFDTFGKLFTCRIIIQIVIDVDFYWKKFHYPNIVRFDEIQQVLMCKGD